MDIGLKYYVDLSSINSMHVIWFIIRMLQQTGIIKMSLQRGVLAIRGSMLEKR